MADSAQNPVTISNTNNGSTNLRINNSINSSNTIFVPDENFSYGQTDDSSAQFLTSTNNNPNNLQENGVLKWNQTERKIQWVRDLETLGDFPNKISQTISRTLPIGDFFTDVQTNVDNFNTSTNHTNEDGESADTKYKWINLSATISDCGLNQLTWNNNDQYYSINDNTTDKILYINCENTADENLGIRIRYLTTTSEKEQQNTYQRIGDYENSLSCYKVNSVEILPNSNSNRRYNAGDIKLYFKIESNRRLARNINFNNGIQELTVGIPGEGENCFTYNCDYLNCQYYNQFYNRNANVLSRTTFTGITTQYGESFLDFSSIDFDIQSGQYELEGGRGRKAKIEILVDESNRNHIKIRISNQGYMYQDGDLLRIKDRNLKNLFFFTVTSTEDVSSYDYETRYTQEIVKAHHGKSNTVKYALGTGETLLLKELNISGSTQSKILVRLIEICKPNKYYKNDTTSDTSIIEDNEPFQRVVREFYYYNRNTINNVHHINKLVYPESEVYVDVQKLLEVNDSDDNKMDTLTFTLNGIKINLEENGSISTGYVMERDI